MSNEEKYPLALPEGTILAGQYTIEKVLGQGGFGITYKANDHKTNKYVAVKEFFPDVLAYREKTTVISYPGERTESYEYGKEGFLQEAQTLAEFIGNENIVRIHSYFEENGTAYFVMDFIEGVSFDEYIKEKGGKISVDEAQNILVPIMDALGAVHSKGIVHRDVTPDNIYITKDNTVKLLDFGAARYSLGDKSRSLDVILKHGFAPKEQYTRRGKQGPFTDIYSLAATFYFAVTGKRPPDSIDRLEEDDLIPPSNLGIKITDRQEEAILKALNLHTSERFHTMADFKNELLNENPAVQQTFFTAPKKETPPVQPVQQVQTAVQPTQETQQSQPVLTPQKPTNAVVSGAAAALKGTNKKVLIGAAAIIVVLVVTLAIVISNFGSSDDGNKHADDIKTISSEAEHSEVEITVSEKETLEIATISSEEAEQLKNVKLSFEKFDGTDDSNEETQQIIWINISRDFVFDCEFANAVFKIKDNAPNGTYPVMIKWNDFSNINADQIKATDIGGSVVVGGNATETQFKNDGSFEIKADSVSGKPGDTVTVSFRFKNNPGICAGILRFAYDPNILEFDKMASEQGADLANALATQNK